MTRSVVLFACLILLASAASAGIIDPCRSSVVFNGTTPENYFACPKGETGSFASAGFSFSLRIVDWSGNPIQNIPKSDIWVVDCDPVRNLYLCGGSASSSADSSTNYEGRTTMSNTALAAGGCANGLSVVCQGYLLGPGVPSPCTPVCVDVRVRSTDLNRDGYVNLSDVSVIAGYYPPAAYNECGDLNWDGRISLSDVSRLGAHFGHQCR
jgi:hypothetical protein